MAQAVHGRYIHKSGAGVGCFLHWGYQGVLPAPLGCSMWPTLHTACVNVFALGPKMAILSKPIVFSADFCTLGIMDLWRARLCAFGLRRSQWTGVIVVVQ